MYYRLYRLWMGAVLAGWLSTVVGVTPTRTDLFKPSEERIAQKLNYLMQYARTTNNNRFASLQSPLKDAAASGTLGELVNLYINQYTTKQAVDVADNVYGTDVSFMILILEKMIAVYYCKLDTLESACHYWEWATRHPTAYAASQLPYRWVTGGSFTSEAERNYAYAQLLRDQYSEEYGAVERLLGAMADGDFINPERWLHDVQALFTGILSAINPEQPNDDLRVIAQKIMLYEKRIASEVAIVKMPHWIKRNWLALTTGVVTVGALYAAYMQNQQSVDGFVTWGWDTTYKHFMQHCYNPAKSFINGIIWDEEVKKRYYIQATLSDTGEVLGYASTPKPLDITAVQADKISQDLRTLGIKTGIDGRDLFLQLTSDVPTQSSSWLPFISALQNKASTAGDGLTKTATGGWQYLAGSDVLLQRLMHEMNQFIDETKFNRRLISLIPATVLAYGGYKGLGWVYNWFTKKDRRALRLKLFQIQELLVRAEQDQLTDREYGRSLYLLNKEYDQAMSNVPPHERAAFIDDLTYLAQTHPSVTQKKETVAIMWGKYNALAMPT